MKQTAFFEFGRNLKPIETRSLNVGSTNQVCRLKLISDTWPKEESDHYLVDFTIVNISPTQNLWVALPVNSNGTVHHTFLYHPDYKAIVAYPENVRGIATKFFDPCCDTLPTCIAPSRSISGSIKYPYPLGQKSSIRIQENLIMISAGVRPKGPFLIQGCRFYIRCR